MNVTLLARVICPYKSVLVRSPWSSAQLPPFQLWSAPLLSLAFFHTSSRTRKICSYHLVVFSEIWHTLDCLDWYMRTSLHGFFAACSFVCRAARNKCTVRHDCVGHSHTCKPAWLVCGMFYCPPTNTKQAYSQQDYPVQIMCSDDHIHTLMAECRLRWPFLPSYWQQERLNGEICTYMATYMIRWPFARSDGRSSGKVDTT